MHRNYGILSLNIVINGTIYLSIDVIPILNDRVYTTALSIYEIMHGITRVREYETVRELLASVTRCCLDTTVKHH